MQFRKFGSLDWHVSVLGFGCMRFPTTDGNPLSGNINENGAIRMLRYAIDRGVNYIDTAYLYHEGNSEIVVGKALQNGYRAKVKLATKSPVWMISQSSDFDKYLTKQLQRLQTEHIDFYLFHSLNQFTWDNVVTAFHLIEKAETAIRDGRIGHIGFSFHDLYPSFPEIVDGYDKWAFCQIQYNYLDIENQAGIQGLKYAASKGLAVVVMEPLLGGKLASPPKPIREIFNGFEKKRTYSDWALQWLYNQPEVSVVLSGMRVIGQVEKNIGSANTSGVNSLGPEELHLVETVRRKFQETAAIPCTGCGYCMTYCPKTVNIPNNFRFYNDGYIRNDVRIARAMYMRFLNNSNRAGACIGCRICETKCPQKIPISQWMPKVHAVLGEGKSY
jgi:predicted aldo/keto reductase-like oxidoreductase